MFSHYFTDKPPLLMFMKDLPLRIKLGLVPLFFILLFSISISIIFNAQEQRKADAEYVNVAGRQRMLSQKIAFLAERLINGENQLTEEFLATIKLCDESLAVLDTGGVALGMSGMEIPAAPESIAEELLASKELWAEYKEHSESLLQGESGDIQFIERNAGVMLTTFNEFVQAYVSLNASKQREQNILLWILLGINVLAGSATIFVVNKHISKPILRITRQLNELTKGSTGIRYSHQSNDEIGQAVKSLNELTDALEKIGDFASEISQGGLEIEYELLSENDKIGASLIQMRDNISQILSEANQVIDSVAQEGDFQVRVNLGDKQGAWNDLSRSVNQMLEAISAPIDQIKNIFRQMAGGDLSVSYQGMAKGEIKELTDDLNNAINKLSALVESLSNEVITIESTSQGMLQTGEEISRSTSEIATAVSQISSGAQIQMNEIDHSSNLLEQMSKSFGSSSKNITEIRSLAMNNKELSDRGADEMAKIISLNEEVLNAFQQSNEAIMQLNKRNDQINRIVSVITDISTQTSLLALNANIEAAHAGDQGRGFAVVADQIRRLASDSKHSSKEIELLIADIQKDITSTMESFHVMNEQITTSVEAGMEASKVIDDISASVKKTYEYSGEIFNAIEGQANSIKSLVTRSTSVVSVAEESAASTEEVAASSEEVSSAMRHYVKKFNELSAIALSLKEQAGEFNLKSEEEADDVTNDLTLILGDKNI